MHLWRVLRLQWGTTSIFLCFRKTVFNKDNAELAGYVWTFYRYLLLLVILVICFLNVFQLQKQQNYITHIFITHYTLEYKPSYYKSLASIFQSKLFPFKWNFLLIRKLINYSWVVCAQSLQHTQIVGSMHEEKMEYF